MGSRRRGFTLLEILLVIVILGIGMAAVAPVAIQSVGVARTRSAIRKIIALHLYGRTRAMRGRELLVMSYDSDNGMVQLISSMPMGNPDEVSPSVPERWLPKPMAEFKPEKWSPLRSVQLPRELRIDRVEGLKHEGSSSFLTYAPNGGSPSYTVELLDNRGDRVDLHFDGISGHVDIRP